MSDEYGPPTLEDDAWFTQYVASLGYPKVKRDSAPMEGQMTLTDVRPHSWDVRDWSGESVLMCVDCQVHGPTDDRDWKDRKDREGCPLVIEHVPAQYRLTLDMSAAEIDRRMMAALDEEREWADEQRAREAEAEQWRDHRPE